MNVSELETKLRSENVPAHLYNIYGNGRRDQRICLVNENGKWSVFFSERGEKFEYKEYDDEQAACQELYDRVLVDMKEGY